MGPVFAFAPDSKSLVWWGNDNTIHLWDLAAGKEVRRWPGRRGHTPRFAFSPDGKTLAVVNSVTTSLIAVASGEELYRIEEKERGPYSLAFSPDGRTLALGLFNRVRLWEVASGKGRLSLGGYERPAHWLAFAPDGRTLVAPSDDGTCPVWDLATGKEVRRITLVGRKRVANPVHRIAISADARMLAWVGGDRMNRVHLTDVGTGKELHAPGVEPWVGLFAFSPDGKRLAVPYSDETLRLLDAATGKELRRFEGLEPMTTYLRFTPDGKSLVTLEKTITVWDAATGKKVRRTHGLAYAFPAPVAISPDGNTLAIGERSQSSSPPLSPPPDCRVVWWDLKAGKQIGRSALAHGGSVTSLAFAPDGKTLASAGVDGTIRLWEVPAGKQVWQTFPARGNPWDVAFTADGKTLLAVQDYFDEGKDAVRVTQREPATGKERGRVAGLPTGIRFDGFSDDGKLLALKTADGIEVREAATGKAVGRVKGVPEHIYHIALTPGGRIAATGNADGTILLWDLTPTAKGRP